MRRRDYRLWCPFATTMRSSYFIKPLLVWLHVWGALPRGILSMTREPGALSTRPQLSTERRGAFRSSSSSFHPGRRRTQEDAVVVSQSSSTKVLLTTTGLLDHSGGLGLGVTRALLQRGDDVVLVWHGDPSLSSSSALPPALQELQDWYDSWVASPPFTAAETPAATPRLSLYPFDPDWAVPNATSFWQHLFTTEQPTMVAHFPSSMVPTLTTTTPAAAVTSSSSHVPPTDTAATAAALIDRHVQETTLLLEAARAYGKTVTSSHGNQRHPIRRWLLATSAADMYHHQTILDQSKISAASSPPHHQTVLHEEDVVLDRPLSISATTLKTAELFAYTWHHLYQIPVTALRVFPTYGLEKDSSNSSNSTALSWSRAMGRDNTGPAEDALRLCDLTHVEDAVQAILKALDPVSSSPTNSLEEATPYQIVNVGQGSPGTTPLDVSQAWALVSGQNLSSDLETSTATSTCAVANITRAQQLWGYRPTISLEEGMGRIWAAMTLNTSQTSLALSEVTTSEAVREETQASLRLRRLLPSATWQTAPVVEPHTGPKTVLVTGGAGFIGSHVADFLLNRGDTVILVDEMNTYYDVRIKEGNLLILQQKYGHTGRLHIHRGDICNATLMESIFADPQRRPQWVCHMAARAGVRPSILDPFVYIHSNIRGTTHLLELSRKYGVHNFVFASSSSVYGGSTSTYFSEDEVVDNPISPYAASKKSCELMAYAYHHLYGLNVTGLRFFTVYGPRGRPDMAPFMFVDRVCRGLKLQQFGDGSSSRDYTYVDDIVDGVVRALDRPYPYQIFNLGKGSGTKLSDFIRLVEKYTGQTALIEILPDQPGDVPYTCADVRKAERLLGYKSSVPFEEGIKRTVEWYMATYPDNVIRKPNWSTQSNSSSSASSPIMKSLNQTASELYLPPSITSPHAETQDVADSGVWRNNKLYVGEDFRNDQFPKWIVHLAFLQWLVLIVVVVFRGVRRFLIPALAAALT